MLKISLIASGTVLVGVSDMQHAARAEVERDRHDAVRGHGLVTQPFAVALLYRLGVYGTVQASYFILRDVLPVVSARTLDHQLYALAVDASNRVHAFVSFVPIYGRHGWGLDLDSVVDVAVCRA